MEQDIVDDRSPRGSLTQHSPTQESDRIALVDRDGTVARGAATSRAALSAAPCEDQPSRITPQLARQLRGRFDDGKPVHTVYDVPSSQTSVTADDDIFRYDDYADELTSDAGAPTSRWKYRQPTDVRARGDFVTRACQFDGWTPYVVPQSPALVATGVRLGH